MGCTAITNAMTMIRDLLEEMETLRVQLRILQCVVSNGKALTQDYVPRLILES